MVYLHDTEGKSVFFTANTNMDITLAKKNFLKSSKSLQNLAMMRATESRSVL